MLYAYALCRKDYIFFDITGMNVIRKYIFELAIQRIVFEIK